MRTLDRHSAWFLTVVVVLAAILFGGAAAIVAGIRTETWTSTVDLVYDDSATGLDASAPSNDDVGRTLATQASVVVGDEVMILAGSKLDLARADLVDATTVTVVADSRVLTISVEASSAQLAARRTQTVALSYAEVTRAQQRAELRRQASALSQPIAALRARIDKVPQGEQTGYTAALQSSLGDQVQRQLQLRAASQSEPGPVRQVTSAVPPTSPSTITALTAALVGAAVGLVLGIGLVLLIIAARRPMAPPG